MTRRNRKKHRNPDGSKNVAIALAAGVGVYLLTRMLQKSGALGNGGGEKKVVNPEPYPVYKPIVVKRLKAIQNVIPTSGTRLQPLYRALKNITIASVEAPKEAKAEVSARTAELNKLLSEKNSRIATASRIHDESRRNAMVAATQKQYALQEEVARANKLAAEKALDIKKKRSMDYTYNMLLMEARKVRADRAGLRNEFGEKGDLVVEAITAALIAAGDDEVQVTEGSIENP